MKNSILTTSTVAAIVWASGSTLAADHCCPTTCTEPVTPVALAPLDDEAVLETIASNVIHALPLDHQLMIKNAGGLGADAVDAVAIERIRDKHADLDILGYELPDDVTVADLREILISDQLDARMTDFQRTLIDRMIELFEQGTLPPMTCFAPGTDSEFVEAINNLHTLASSISFQANSRWSSTATNGGGLSQGDPTTLTYSFVPDGTFVPNLIGVSGNSNFRSWMNGIYGNQATWQPLFDQVFARWAELCGLSYQFEPNDDGVTLNNAPGQLGVRGDVRIAAIAIDGNSNTLAYNNFPNDGDMVFDSADNFYNTTSGNSRRLRNVTAHEHGHGIGMNHVCPIQQTKLMEPFYSGSFDGPQLDDILLGHRHYGDNDEPNNSLAQTTDLGNVNTSTFLGRQNLSIDDNSDRDFFEINLTEPAEIVIAVAPAADEYLNGPQNFNGSCSAGTLTDYNSIHNLRISVYTEDDLFNPQATANENPAGQSEFLTYQAESAGTVWIEIDASTNTNSVQRYSLTLVGNDLPFLGPILSAEEPANVDPGVTTEFDVTIDPRNDTIVGTPQLFTSINGGSFIPSNLVSNGGNSYTATLPAANCDDTVEFFIQAEGDTAGTINLPPLGASEPYTALVGDLVVTLDDDFETDTGWTVSGSVTTAAAGRWQRAVPAGANDDRISDPGEDFDGSGQCYVTGNILDNSDVDGGDTILTSPLLDLGDSPEAMISYARWFDNNEGGDAANPFTEIFQVQISNNNGSTWTGLETVGPNGPEVSGGWFTKEFRVADFVTPTSQVRVRFIAKDDFGTIVEAGVDAFTVSGLVCEDPMTDCPPDLTMDGSLDFFDVSALLNNEVDYNGDTQFDFFDISQFLQDFGDGCP
jgi:hypothetical protein